MGGAGLESETARNAVRRAVPCNPGGAGSVALTTLAPRNSSSSTVSSATGDDLPAALTAHCAPGALP